MSQWDCLHDTTEVRTKRIAGGGIQYREQCLTCGRSASNAIAASTMRDFPAEWDEDLHERWQQAIRDSIAARTTAAQRMRSEEYAAYLASTAWKEKREAVLARDRWICQGCRAERACDVHHLTYSHFGRELLFQLVALCRACHDAAHEEPHVA